jgi:hypothetical protein
MADHQLIHPGAVPNNNPQNYEDDEMVNAKEIMESLLAELRKDREMVHAKEVMQLVELRKNREMGEYQLAREMVNAKEVIELRNNREALLVIAICALIYCLIIRGE